MSDAFLAAWWSDTALPLVAGGDVHIAGALASAVDPDAAPSTFVGALLAARMERLARTTALPIGLPFGDVELRLLRALANLCALLHPAVSRRQQERIFALVEHDLDLPPVTDAEEALRRHSLTWRLFRLERNDVRVRFWAGEQKFVGQAIPKRLLRWQSVRRVHQEMTAVRLVDEWRESGRSVEAWPLVQKLAQLSPLTVLVEPLAAPQPLLLPAARVLASPVLMRATLAALFAHGIDNALARWASALVEALAKPGPTARIAVQFFCHALTSWAIGAGALTTESLRAELDLRWPANTPEARVAALYAAAYRVELAAPPRLPPVAAERVERLAHAAAEHAGEPAVRGLMSRLALIDNVPYPTSQGAHS